MHEHNSEIARLRNQIAMEYQAAQQVFTGFTFQGQHTFITKRQENIGACYRELLHHLSPQEAMATLIEATESIQPSFSSSGNTS